VGTDARLAGFAAIFDEAKFLAGTVYGGFVQERLPSYVATRCYVSALGRIRHSPANKAKRTAMTDKPERSL
jgi:hypothetical protein